MPYFLDFVPERKNGVNVTEIQNSKILILSYWDYSLAEGLLEKKYIFSSYRLSVYAYEVNI